MIMTPRLWMLALVCFASATVRAQSTGRPLVLLVHGRGYLTRDSATFRRESLTALRESAFRATGDSLLGDADFRIVWYADLMDPRRRSTSSCDGRDRKSQDDSPASVFQALAMVASALLDASAQEKDTTDVRDLAGDLRFFGDPGTRCATEVRIADALARARDEGRPVILVAHSLGALVTWGHLTHRADATDRALPDIRRLVTIGSPIGNQQLRELFFGPSAPVTLPRNVRSWVNALNPSDPFASRLVSDSTNAITRPIAGISDLLTAKTTADPHELRGYLRDSATAKAVLGAWCEAADAKSRVSRCSKLVP